MSHFFFGFTIDQLFYLNIMSGTLVLYVLCSVSIFIVTSGLECYNCSGDEMNCLDPYNSSEKHLEQCPTAGVSEFAYCLKTIKYTDGEDIIKRSCATKQNENDGCLHIMDYIDSIDFDIICACFEDKCNGSSDLELMSAMHALLIFMLMAFAALITRG